MLAATAMNAAGWRHRTGKAPFTAIDFMRLWQPAEAQAAGERSRRAGLSARIKAIFGLAAKASGPDERPPARSKQ